MRSKLTPIMVFHLRLAAQGRFVRPGPTRAALMRRGLLFNMEAVAENRGKITPLGCQIFAELEDEA